MDSSDWRDEGASSGDKYGRGGWGRTRQDEDKESNYRSGGYGKDDKESNYRSGGYGNDSGGYGKSDKGDKGGRNSWGQQSERYPREARAEPRERQIGVVSLRGRGLGDDDLPADRNFSGQCRGAEEINFAENYITGTGLAWVLKPIQQFEYLRVLKLHKNNIGDSAADPLVKLCRNAPALCEMHLSHNQITWVGADKIVRAACERQILKVVEKREANLWLRLEQNQIEDAKQLFDDWVARGLDICMYNKTDGAVPPSGVIMPYFTSQRTEGSGKTISNHEKKEDNSWKEQWSAGYSSSWADSKAWKAEDTWGWDKPEKRSYSSKGKGKNKGKEGSDTRGADKGGKSSKGAKKGKDASGKGKKSDALGETGASRMIVAKNELADDDLEKFFDEQREKSSDDADQLDLSSNCLVGIGFKFLQDYCINLANLSIVKLHKNLLTDEAAPYLAKMCGGACPALSELHLSHNRITRTGAEEIVVAACELRAAHQSADDNEADGDDEAENAKVPPLWLRLEYNEISEPQTLVDDWKSRELCITAYPAGASRHGLKAGVHIPFFFSQGKPTHYVHSSEAASKEESTIEYKAERSKARKAKESEKKPAQLKWVPKKKPAIEGEAATVEIEANEELKEESREDANEQGTWQKVESRSAKALEKKLRQIEQLEERYAKGESLNEDQLSKIAARAKVEADLNSALNFEEAIAGDEGYEEESVENFADDDPADHSNSEDGVDDVRVDDDDGEDKDFRPTCLAPAMEDFRPESLAPAMEDFRPATLEVYSSVFVDNGKDNKDSQKGKTGQRRSADDDADATVFSSGEESCVSARSN